MCILVDKKIVFSANIFQVALIALFLHEVALAERYVWHVTAIAVGLLGTAQNIVSLADAVETAYALSFLIKGYISQYQMVWVLTLTDHGLQPLVVAWAAIRFCQNNPFMFGSLHTQCNLQFLAAHVA